MISAMVAVVATLAGLGAPAPAAGPERVCRVTDERLTEMSGLAATADGYVVVNDGADQASHRKIFFLNGRCRVVRAVGYPSRPRDTEDLALAADGTVWVGDIGDNSRSRTTIALWRLAPGARSPKLFRMSYPDGPHDAEALLLTRAGSPVVVTKSVGGGSVYVPDGSLRAGRTTPLRRAGAVSLPATGTGNPFGLPGRLVITGGAVSPDGRRAVLRTYADAFEFDVPGDDVVRAVTEGEPRTVPLPDEPQGESITYSPDGTALLTVSEAEDGADLLRYRLPGRPATTAPKAATSTASAARSAPAAAGTAAGGGIPVGALLTGAVLVAAAAAVGAATWRRRRSQRR